MTAPKIYARFTEKRQFSFAVEQLPYTVIFILERGRFHYRIGSLEGEALQGDILICPPEIPFERRVLEPVTLHVLRFDTDQPIKAGRISGELARICTDLGMLGAGESLFITDFTEAERHFSLDIFYTLTLQAPTPAPSEAITDHIVVEAKRKIDTAFSERLTVAALAAEQGIGSVGFIRRFERALGVTPNAYIIGCRMREAIRLLTETELPIAVIAEQCGYENGFYFSNSFKKKYGCSPSTFRRGGKV